MSQLISKLSEDRQIETLNIDGRRLLLHFFHLIFNFPCLHISQHRVKIDEFPLCYIHCNPEKHKDILTIHSLKEMPCPIELQFEKFPVKHGKLQTVELEIHLFELLHFINKFYNVLYPGQSPFIIISQGFLFHPTFLPEFSPVIEEFKIIHHHENFLNNFVVYPPYGGYFLIQKLIPVQFLIDYNSYCRFIKVKEL